MRSDVQTQNFIFNQVHPLLLLPLFFPSSKEYRGKDEIRGAVLAEALRSLASPSLQVRDTLFSFQQSCSAFKF